jgi:hypothetical protein
MVVCPSFTSRQRTPDDLAPSEHALNPPMLDLRRRGPAHVLSGRHSDYARCHDAPPITHLRARSGLGRAMSGSSPPACSSTHPGTGRCVCALFLVCLTTAACKRAWTRCLARPGLAPGPAGVSMFALCSPPLFSPLTHSYCCLQTIAFSTRCPRAHARSPLLHHKPIRPALRRHSWFPAGIIPRCWVPRAAHTTRCVPYSLHKSRSSPARCCHAS